MESSLQGFKMQIESMFQKSFQQLNQKNQLNKNILSNLLQAAHQQTRQISSLDDRLQSIQQKYKTQNQPQISFIKKQVQRHQEVVHDNFNLMMYRLQQIQQGINNSKKTIEQNIRNNQQAEQKMDKMIFQMEDVIKKQNIPQYKGDRDILFREIQSLQNVLKTQLQRQRNSFQNIQFNKKTLIQPLNTFQTKIALHNKANEQILRQKLSSFTDKIRKLQKKVQQTSWMMNSEISKSNQQQRKIIEEMNILQNQMAKIRIDLEHTDQRRKQTMQSHALTLDNMVEEMLSQAKKLQIRVESLRKGYQDENQKLKNQIYNQKMTI